MAEPGSDEYPPTPTHLRSPVVRYRCGICQYEASSRELDPLLGMLCPMCFRRVLAKANVPMLEPVLFAPPVKPPPDDEDTDPPLERRTPRRRK